MLNNKQIVSWIKNELSFLKNKKDEDSWGFSIVKTCINENFSSKQWTTTFGEQLAKELIEKRFNITLNRPKKTSGMRPDWESTDFIWEIKTGTYFTTGTAHEKIAAVPYKYAEVPALYKKPVKIVCLGRAEIEADKLGLFNPTNDSKRQFLEFYSKMGFTFIKGSSLIE